jgi:hypothetical protein
MGALYYAQRSAAGSAEKKQRRKAATYIGYGVVQAVLLEAVVALIHSQNLIAVPLLQVVTILLIFGELAMIFFSFSYLVLYI